jgi:hypothetical protein
MRFMAVGGTPPYTWSTTSGILSGAGSTRTLTAPPNSGSGVVGVAYTQVKIYAYCFSSGTCDAPCGPLNAFAWTHYNCDDSINANATADAVGDPTGCGPTFGTCAPGTCGSCPTCLASGGPCSGIVTYPTSIAAGTALHPVTGGSQCDKRTGGMVSGGCVPCGIAMNGAVVTITDATGVSVSKTVNI